MLAAAWNGSPAVVLALLDAGANAKATDASGRRPVDHGRQNDALLITDAYARLSDASFD